MKKLLFLTIVLTLLTACSSDDSPATTPTETVVRLKKVVSTDEEGKMVTSDYKYTGTQLTSIISTDGSSSIYTYTDGLNTGIENYENYTLKHSYTYKYDDNNKLSAKILFIHDSFPKLAQKDVYTYNENGTMTIKSYTGTFESQTQLAQTTTVTYPDTNTIQYESQTGSKIIYNYDGKNNPLKNVLETEMYPQNLLSIVSITPVEYITYLESTYTYNSKNYPTTSTQKVYVMGQFKTSKTQFFYE